MATEVRSFSQRPSRLVITKHFDFEAAHRLPFHNGKCKRPHGHSYHLAVSLIGDIQEDTDANVASGMVLDFGEVSSSVKAIIGESLDHYDLNITVHDNPTAERILAWIVEKLYDVFGVMLYEVTLWETKTASVTWKKHLHG